MLRTSPYLNSVTPYSPHISPRVHVIHSPAKALQRSPSRACWTRIYLRLEKSTTCIGIIVSFLPALLLSQRPLVVGRAYGTRRMGVMEAVFNSVQGNLTAITGPICTRTTNVRVYICSVPSQCIKASPRLTRRTSHRLWYVRGKPLS